METKIEKIKKFLEEQKQKSLEFYKSTKLDNFTGEVVAFDLVSKFIKELEQDEKNNEVSVDNKPV